ncbi:MAG: hypothetical protein ACI8Z5_002598 [Lentimonas sp.]|jgi:hypothetical protein
MRRHWLPHSMNFGNSPRCFRAYQLCSMPSGREFEFGRFDFKSSRSSGSPMHCLIKLGLVAAKDLIMLM